jgi:hypothetical protein
MPRGNRLRYATHADLTNKTKGFHNESKPNPGDSWSKVCSTNDCSEVIADDVPVVLISRGANGWGALNINGNTLATPTSSDELGNQDADRRYVSRPPPKSMTQQANSMTSRLGCRSGCFSTGHVRRVAVRSL